MMIPTLTTERLTLRAPRLSDFDAHRAFQDLGPRAFRRRTRRPKPTAGATSRALIGQWELRGYGRWMVTETGQPTGPGHRRHHSIRFDWPEAEIGWTVFAEGEGKGYAYEAAVAPAPTPTTTLGWTTARQLRAPRQHPLHRAGQAHGLPPRRRPSARHSTARSTSRATRPHRS